MSLYDGQSEPEDWHLLRKLILLVLLVVAATLGLVILFRESRTIPLTWFSFFADASLGFLAGMGSRLVLRRRHGLIQGLASAALSIVGLSMLGFFTDARLGIGPLPTGSVHLPWLDWAHLGSLMLLQPLRPTMDLLDLAHMVIAVDTSWIVLRAWKRRPANSVARPNRRRQAPLARVSVGPHGRSGHVRAPASSSSRPKVGGRRSGRPLISMRVAAVRSSASRRSSRWNPLRRKLGVHLAVHEEHRCPYCLEDVNRRDARGVVECPICHTLHHKECWDVTGTCQVPHLNT